MAQPPSAIHVRIGRITVHGANPPSSAALSASLREALEARFADQLPTVPRVGDVASEVSARVGAAFPRPGSSGEAKR